MDVSEFSNCNDICVGLCIEFYRESTRISETDISESEIAINLASFAYYWKVIQSMAGITRIVKAEVLACFLEWS